MLTEKINDWTLRKLVKSKLEGVMKEKSDELVLEQGKTTKDVVTKLTELIDSINNDYETLKQSHDKLHAENTDLKDTITDKDNKLKKANAEIGLLQESNKELKNKNYQLTTENNIIKMENNKMQDKLLDAAIAHHQDKNAHAYIGLKQKYEELQDENKSIKDTVNLVGSVVHNVEKQNKLLKSKVYTWGNAINKIVVNSQEKDQNRSKILEASR